MRLCMRHSMTARSAATTTTTAQGYCLQSDVMSENAQNQTALFCAHYADMMQKLTPPVYPDCSYRPMWTELRVPDNQVCKEQTLNFIKNNQRRFNALRFTTLAGKLVVDERPPDFRSPWWLRMLLLLIVLVLILAHFIALDRLTFL